MVVVSDEQWLRSLRQQAANIDALELYIRACERRGSTDEVALSTHGQAIRTYRRALSVAPLQVLFLYGCEVASARQT